MVYMREMCTLRAFLELERNGEELKKDWILDAANYAACGGGFPLRLKNGCVVGAICVSGLPHLQDHKHIACAASCNLSASVDFAFPFLYSTG